MNTKNNSLGNNGFPRGMRVFLIMLCLGLGTIAITLADGNTTDGSSAYQYTSLNTTTDATLVNEIHAGGNVSNYNYIATNGSVDVYVNGQNIYDETGQLKSYIASSQSAWSQDSKGMVMGDLINALQRIALYKSGQGSSLSTNDAALLNYLEVIYSIDTKSYVAGSLAPRDAAFQVSHDTIQKNIYDIEAIYRTLEQTSDADIYCKSRIDVAAKYNLSSIKCGLHSKMCYVGSLNYAESGRDFCVHTDNDLDYLPCMNTLGRCGKLTAVSVQASEENSFIPVTLTYSNPGTMTLSPSVKVELQRIDSSDVLASSLDELGSLKPNEEKTYAVYLNTSNVTAGKYVLWVTVISSRKEILQDFNYTVLARGEVARQGDLFINPINPSQDGKVEILGSYKNTKNLSYVAEVRIEVSPMEGNASTVVQEKGIYVKAGETKEFKFEYAGNAAGNYSVTSQVKGTGVIKNSSFMIAPKALVAEPNENYLTGKFMAVLPQIYEFAIIVVVILSVYIAIRWIGGRLAKRSGMNDELV